MLSIMPDEMEQLKQSVADRVKANAPTPIVRVGSESHPFGLFVEFHSFLVSAGVTEIHRLYASEDESQAPQGGFLWQFYSPQDLEKNLKILFDNLPVAYSALVEQNFPQLKDKLLPFDGAERVVAVLDIGDQHESNGGVDFYYLKSQGGSGVRIDLHRKSPCSDLVDRLRVELGESVELDGKTYELIGESSRALTIVWVRFPMLSLVYTELGGALARYFEKPGAGEPPWWAIY